MGTRIDGFTRKFAASLLALLGRCFRGLRNDRGIGQELSDAFEFLPNERIEASQCVCAPCSALGLYLLGKKSEPMGMNICGGTFKLMRSFRQGRAVAFGNSMAYFGQLLLAAGDERRGQFLSKYLIACGNASKSFQVNRRP
jgi:hypothetical protein